MHKYIILLFSFSILFSSDNYVDFGIIGKTYKIEEENGNDFIEKRIKEIDWNLAEKELNQRVEEAFTSKINLPDSIKDSNIKELDLVAIRWDIKNIQGEIIYKKGDLVSSVLPLGAKLEICFINGKENNEVIEYLIKEFGSNCIYLVNNIDSREFEEKYNVESYPIAEQNLIFLERFNIKELPTKIIKEKDTIEKRTINIIGLRKQLLINQGRLNND